MTNIIKETVVELDSKNSNMYEENATKYINEINVLHEEFKNVVSNAKRKTIVFADRFPFKYFALEYGIDYKAAYNSCSSESEVSAKTLSELIDYVNDNNIPTVFYLELSNQNIANTIQNETDCDKKLFHSGQNVTSEEFKNGITLLEIMENNFENSLYELENIIKKLENSDTSLEESILLFEKGIKLSDSLRKILEKAEKKITTLTEAEREEEND